MPATMGLYKQSLGTSKKPLRFLGPLPELSIFLILSKEPLINVCEAVSAAKVAALGEAKISEPKRSEDGTRRVSSFSCVQKAQFIGHK